MCGEGYVGIYMCMRVSRGVCWRIQGYDILDLILKFLNQVQNKKEKAVKDVLSEQAYIFPKRPFFQPKGNQQPHPQLCLTTQQSPAQGDPAVPAELTPRARWGGGGGAAPTFRTVFQCSQVCTSTSCFLRSRCSQWQNLKTEKQPQ